MIKPRTSASGTSATFRDSYWMAAFGSEAETRALLSDPIYEFPASRAINCKITVTFSASSSVIGAKNWFMHGEMRGGEKRFLKTRNYNKMGLREVVWVV